MTVYLHLAVKFRALFVTFGSIDKWFALNADLVGRKLSTSDADGAPVGIRRTLFDGRGVLLEVVTGF